MFPFRRKRDEFDYAPRYVRFEFFRNLFALAIAIGAVALAANYIPRFFDDDEESGSVEVEVVDTIAESDTSALSGRYQPTTLTVDHTWIGSFGDTVEAPPYSIDRRIVLAVPDDDSLSRSIVVDLATVGSRPPLQFDTAQVPFEILDSEAAQLLVAIDDDPSSEHVVANLFEGRQLWITAHGVSVDEIVTVVNSVSVFEPPQLGDEAESDGSQVQVSFGTTLDLRVATDVAVAEEERAFVVDNFVVPGRAEFSVAVRHYTGWSDFDPVAVAAESGTATVTRVRGTDAVFDRVLVWQERADLILEVEGQGYTQDEIERIAEGLRELTDDELNRRRPPTEEVTVSFEPVPGPDPEFATDGLGRRAELLSAVDSEPPFAEGQLIGPMVAVGRIEGTDIDVYTWQRGDGRFAECVAVVGTGVGATFCLTDEDVDEVSGPRRVGAAWITEGPNAGGRVHVYRVSGRAAITSTVTNGEAISQRPVEGINAFVSGDATDLRVRTYEVDGSELL